MHHASKAVVLIVISTLLLSNMALASPMGGQAGGVDGTGKGKDTSGGGGDKDKNKPTNSPPGSGSFQSGTGVDGKSQTRETSSWGGSPSYGGGSMNEIGSKVSKAIDDYKGLGDTFLDKVGNFIGGMFGFNEIDPSLPGFSKGTPAKTGMADWGLDPLGAILGGVGMGFGVPGVGALYGLGKYATGWAGPQINMGPSVFGGPPRTSGTKTTASTKPAGNTSGISKNPFDRVGGIQTASGDKTTAPSTGGERVGGGSTSGGASEKSASTRPSFVGLGIDTPVSEKQCLPIPSVSAYAVSATQSAVTESTCQRATRPDVTFSWSTRSAVSCGLSLQTRPLGATTWVTLAKTLPCAGEYVWDSPAASTTYEYRLTGTASNFDNCTAPKTATGKFTTLTGVNCPR